MAKTPEGATGPVGAPRPLPNLPPGCIFQPNGPNLLKHYLFPKAVGRVPYGAPGSVADGVDVYTVRPEALPFPNCNRRLHDQAWDYYFTTTRPAAAGGSGSGDDVRDVAAGGCWRRYGAEKEYVGDDGEVYGFRRRFAFHEAGDPGKKTVWRMKEFRLKETAPTFRGAVNAKGLVICKVYNDVYPEEEPAVDYYDMEDDSDDEEIGAVVITVGDVAAAPTP